MTFRQALSEALPEKILGAERAYFRIHSIRDKISGLILKLTEKP